MDTLTPLLCGLAAIVLVAIVLIANAIRIVPEYQRLVVFPPGARASPSPAARAWCFSSRSSIGP